MMWTLFVLDMDGTYNNEEPNSVGVQPFVYLVPLDKQRDVEYYAGQASRDFHSEENSELGLGIGDYFEEWLGNNGIDFKPVGSIDLTLGERQVDYLANYIPREIV